MYNQDDDGSACLVALEMRLRLSLGYSSRIRSHTELRFARGLEFTHLHLHWLSNYDQGGFARFLRERLQYKELDRWEMMAIALCALPMYSCYYRLALLLT